MHKILHPRDDRDRLYVSRKEGGRAIANIEDCAEATIQQLEEYTKKSKEGYLWQPTTADVIYGQPEKQRKLENKGRE